MTWGVARLCSPVGTGDSAEEPLGSDLDVAGLRAQVLGRIEELEKLERERKEMLAELVPAMESRGYDTEGVKAMLGG